VDAIRAAALGRTLFSSGVHAAVATAIRGHDATMDSRLTRREHDVMYLSATGNSVANMAALMHVSRTTVKTHLANAYRKLGACDRASAVAQAMKRGIITLD
jgi:two-component system nitrate/nitrite response regulator NarL